MCDADALEPPAVARALREYRELLDEHGPAWGEDPIGYVRQMAASAYLMDEHDYWITCLRKVLDEHSGAFAHTSPVHLHVDGRHVAREADLRWCLEYLDGLEGLLRRTARIEHPDQLAAHLDLLDAARAVYGARLAGGG